MKLNNGGKPFIIILTALAIVAVVSLLPLGRLTGGYLSDFNLLGDIMPCHENEARLSPGTPAENIDPELLKLEANDSIARDMASDSIVRTDSAIQAEPELPHLRPTLVDGEVAIEDYSTDGNGMKALKDAIREGRLARIAFLGDSYIEGDILCQDFRAMMQERYGGSGVGYMNLHSEFPGFRQSVRQDGKGWKELSVRKGAKSEYIGLSENYFIPSGKATASYKGVNKIKCADSWDVSRLLVVAPRGGQVKTHIDSDTTDWTINTLEPSPEVQCVRIDGRTSQFKLETSTESLVALGVWLDSRSGVSVDCMSSRGYSGLTLSKTSLELCRQESSFVNYQLIILEFGINAMSSEQSDYSVYAKGMARVIGHLRQCYPGAGILVMGIGDRGEKRGGEVHSMYSAEGMVTAQRNAARMTGSMFWDTREAMGGNESIVAYASEGLANKDYVHLTHKGGKRLAGHLFNAFTKVIDQ